MMPLKNIKIISNKKNTYNCIFLFFHLLRCYSSKKNKITKIAKE